MRQAVEHHVRDEKKGRKQQREHRCVGVLQWIHDPAPNSVIESDGFDNHVPTIEAKESAEIDAKTTQPGYEGNKNPTGDAPDRVNDEALNQVKGNETQDKSR